MTTKEAIESMLVQDMTKYQLAKTMGCAPISINQWLRGTKMSDYYRHIFYKRFGIEIDDTV